VAEIQLDEVFAAFEAETAGTFRPEPLAELAGRVRRRQGRYRLGLLALLTLLLVGPATGLAVANRRTGPPPTPEPTATASPTPRASRSTAPSLTVDPERRPVAVPGVDLPLAGVWVLPDALHLWASFDSCVETSGGCRYALARSADGGRSWQPVTLPDAQPPGVLNFYPLSPTAVTVHQVSDGFWRTTDGGTHWTRFPADQPPPEALWAGTDPLPGGRYRLLCPGATGFEDGAKGVTCTRQRLVRVGGTVVDPQPDLPGELYQVAQGGDGRLWLVSATSSGTRIAWSADDAHTWHEIPTQADNPHLTVSPDGTEVYLVDDFPTRVWRLAGDAFVEVSGVPEGVPDFQVVALGGGVLAICAYDGSAYFWRDGTLTALSGQYQAVSPVGDGSVLLRALDGSYLVGAGTGLARSWYQLS